MAQYLQLQVWLMLALVLFCGAQTWRDFSRGDYVWAAVGAGCAIAIIIVLLLPIPTHAVKFDLIR